MENMEVRLSVPETNAHSSVRPYSNSSDELLQKLLRSPNRKKICGLIISEDPEFVLHYGANGSKVLRGVLGHSREVTVRKKPENSSARFNLEKLNHPNIVNCIFYDSHEGFTLLVREYCELSLDEWFELNQEREDKTLRGLTRDLLQGLSYLHNQNMIHGAVQHNKVLLAQDGGSWTAKLIVSESSLRETSSYADKIEETRKLGKLLFFTLTGGKTYTGPNCDDGFTLTYTEWNFILYLTADDPAKRMSVKAALRHPIFWSKNKWARYLRYLNYVDEVMFQEDINTEIFKGWIFKVRKNHDEVFQKMEHYVNYKDHATGLLHFYRNYYEHTPKGLPEIPFLEIFPDLFEQGFQLACKKGWNSREKVKELFE